MMSEDGRYIVTFNGEIYNFQALRQRLEAKGTRFRSQSDTEVLLQAYRAYGESCLELLTGCTRLPSLTRCPANFFVLVTRLAKNRFIMPGSMVLFTFRLN